MKTNAIRFALGCLLAVSSAVAPFASAQSGRYSSESVTLGAGGYTLNFGVLWTCDDDTRGTASSAGEIDLVDGGGNLAARVLATVDAGSPVVTVTGAGAVSGVTTSINIYGAAGTPADGYLHGTWSITGLGPGAYTLRFWFSQRSVAGKAASTITTEAMDSGGGGTVGGAPTPTPTPTPSPTRAPSPPSVSLAAPVSPTVFQAASVGATALASAGGNPLASVSITVSEDNGTTWSPIVSDSHPSSPSDSEVAQYAFAVAGAATLRAVATDTTGLTATATQAVSVGKANPPAVSVSPASSSLVAGQSVAFAASGGATGTYAWGGSASGSGASQAVTFTSPGTFAVTAVDPGNANYNPSATASATVTVQAAFYTLSVAATAGGSAAGGGSYPPNAQASAIAACDPGNMFAGWTGDVTGANPSISVLMNASKSITAHFSALLSQSISFVQPGPVTIRTPAFALLASASSGLPVTLALTSGPASLAADVVTPEGTTGQVTITASQPGNSQYLPAQPVVISFPIGSPPVGVILADDSPATKKSDKATRTTSYTSGPEH